MSIFVLFKILEDIVAPDYYIYIHVYYRVLSQNSVKWKHFL